MSSPFRSIPTFGARLISVTALFGAATAATLLLGGADDGAPVRAMQGDQAERPYAGHRVVRTRLATARELRTMLALSDDPWSESVGVGVVDFRVAPDAFAALQRTDIEFTVLIDDVQALVDSERARIAAAAEGGIAGDNWFTEYRTWEQVDAYIDELVALRPDLASTFEVGHSIEGRLVRGIRIGHDPQRNKPAMLLHGCQHAREWISVMVTTYAADALVRGHGIDPAITALVDAMEFLVVPVVNPDGYVFSWGPDRLWRKNRRVNGDGTFGVDPNRNWGFGWGGAGSSGNTSSQTYRGVAPFSEPEVANLRDLMLKNPQITTSLDIHSYSQLILAPWGFTTDLPPDNDVFDFLGQRQAELIEEVDGSVYVHGPAGPTLYVASGIAADWVYGELGVWGFTYELRDTGQFGFLLPADQIIPNSLEVLPAILFLADWAAQPVQIDLPTGAPSLIEADEPTPLTVRVLEIADIIDNAAVSLHSRIGTGGEFTMTPLTETDAPLFAGSLPAAPCGSVVQFFIEVLTESGTIVRFPTGAPTELLEAAAQSTTVIFADDFTTDLGWTAGAVDDTATAGLWVRAVPVGTFVAGTPVQPSAAFEGPFCWITGQHPGGTAGANDVDNGKTTLLSPVFDLSDVTESSTALVSYWRWYSNAAGASPFNDVFTADISADGGETWMPLEVVGPTPPEVNGAWFFREWDIAQFVPLTGDVRFRFVASDFDPQALIEAALDAFRIRTVGCAGASSPIGDLNGDGVVDGADLGIMLNSWACGGCSADLDGNGTVDGADLGILLNAWSAS